MFQNSTHYKLLFTVENVLNVLALVLLLLRFAYRAEFFQLVTLRFGPDRVTSNR